VLELAGLVWEKQAMTGDRVYLKLSASTEINEDEVLVFGGYDLKGVPVSTLSKINWSTASLTSEQENRDRRDHRHQALCTRVPRSSQSPSA